MLRKSYAGDFAGHYVVEFLLRYKSIMVLIGFLDHLLELMFVDVLT